LSESVTLSPTRVFLLAENRLLRDALVRILSKKTDTTVVGAVAYTPEVFEQLLASNAEVALLDSPSLAFHGPCLVATIRRIAPDLRIVMIGMERDEAAFFRAVCEGVMGYVLKDASALEIVSVIRAVAAGEAICPPCFSKAIFAAAAKYLSTSTELTVLSSNGLSRREQQLVGLVRIGLTNKEIAARLNLSERTIKNHVHRIFRKVGVRDRVAMVERCSHDVNTKSPLLN
jgi:DNA-binding NarL/FixJ family response regulator